MKTVKGEVLSTTPISISRAASILSKFVSADTGASQAVCAYLRRASASFDELNQLHKELKSHRKRKNPKLETLTEDGEPSRRFVSDQQDGEESERKKDKKKKKKQRVLVGNMVKSEGEFVDDRVRIKIEESDLSVEDEKRKHKKKKGEIGNLEDAKDKLKLEEDVNVRIDDNCRKRRKKYKGENGGKFGYLEDDKMRVKIEEDGDMGMDNGRKKDKRKRETSLYQVDDLKENGGNIVVVEEEEKNKKKKKRKSEEIEEGMEINSEESQRKKRKKRKIEGES